MGGLALLVAGCATCTAAVDAAAGGLPGTVRAHETVGGQFAVAAVNATINHPRAIYLRLAGNVETGTIVVPCSRGFSISSSSYDQNRGGFLAVPIRPAHVDSCHVGASVGGSGLTTVEIRAL